MGMDLALSPAVFSAVFIAMGIGAVLQASVGYGMALIAGPFLVLIDPRFVPGPLLVSSVVLSLLMANREKQSIDLWGLKWALAGRIPSAFLGAAILAAIPKDYMIVTFGGLVLLAVAMSASGLRFPARRRVLFSAGVLSGLMGTIASIGGPPIALVYQDAPGRRLRATLSGYFIVGAVISIIALISIGRFGRAEMWLSLLLLPSVLVGFLVSNRVVPVLDRGYTHTAVLVVAALSGLVVIVQQIL
jgi:uncharacterized membrane protein YfcA